MVVSDLCPVVSEMSGAVSGKCPVLVSDGVRVVSETVSEMSGLCPKRCPKCPVRAQLRTRAPPLHPFLPAIVEQRSNEDS